MIYLLVFTLSIISTYLAQRTVSQKLGFYIFSAIAILLPSLLAGFRDSGIGTDTLIYADDVWEKITYCDDWKTFVALYVAQGFSDIELGYLLVNFIVYLAGGDLHTLYFTTNFIVVLFFYLAAYDNRKKASMWLIMAFFFLSYYNISLNLIRQSIAIAISVYSFKYLEQHKWWKYILWQVIILSSHNTAFLNLLIIPIYFIPQIKNIKKKRRLIILFLSGIAIMFLSMDWLLSFIVSLGILPNKYLMYSSIDSSSVVAKTQTVSYIGILLLLWFITTKIKEPDAHKRLRVYLFGKIASLLLFLTSIVSKHAARVAFYISPLVDCIFFPRALFLLKQRSSKWYLQSVCMSILLLLAVWYWLIIIRGDTETYPYKSTILNIN